MYNFNITHGFGLEVKSHAQLEFVDVFTNKDTPLFIDPLLIQGFDDPLSQLVKYRLDCFLNRLFQLHKGTRDEAAIAELFSHSSEINETKMGYGNGFNGRGSSKSGIINQFSQLNDIFADGIDVSSPEDIPLLLQGFAEDRFSDLITNVISDILNKFTIQVCNKYGKKLNQAVKPRYFWDEKTGHWQGEMGRRLILEGVPVLLVPKWFVRQKYCYSTEDFFKKKVIKFMQQEQITKDGKKPTCKELEKHLVTEYGCVHAAVLAILKQYPELLEEYKTTLGTNYSNSNLNLNDEMLDKILKK